MEHGPLGNGLVDLVTFELLEQIDAEGSLSAAAAAMGISQQAASARLGRAERLLGQRLVRRGVGGSVLTEHGVMVLEWAAPVLDAARRAAVSLDALRHLDAPLTVAASQTNAEFLLPGWLQTFRREAPGATVRLVSGNSADVVARVRAGGAQLGFVEGPEAPDDLHSAILGRDELVLVVAPSDQWSGSGTPDGAALAARPLVLREQGSGTRAAFEGWLRAQGITAAPPAAELSTTSAIRAAAAAGVAPAVLSRRAVEDDLAAGRLRRVPLGGDGLLRPLTAIWADPGLSAPARLLLEIVQRRGARSDDRAAAVDGELAAGHPGALVRDEEEDR